MKMRYVKLFVALVASLAVLAIGISVIAQEKQEAPAEIVIKDPTFGALKKPGGVKFPHQKHAVEYKVACTECHHNYVKGKNVWKEGDPVKKCSACHKVAAAEKDALTYCKKTYPKGKAPGLKCAFHMNCTGCHKDLKKKDKVKYAKIPTACTKCHPVKKKK